MIKGKLTPPMHMLVCVASHVERTICSNRTVSTVVLLKIGIY